MLVMSPGHLDNAYWGKTVPGWGQDQPSFSSTVENSHVGKEGDHSGGNKTLSGKRVGPPIDYGTRKTMVKNMVNQDGCI